LSDKNNKEQISQAIYLINQWKLWDHLNIVQICENVVDQSPDHVSNLIGKKSDLDEELKMKYGK
jgi:hypothetical protein